LENKQVPYYSSGYTISRLIGLEEKECRTIAIEVGMQNSGLAVTLALKYNIVATALPEAVFSIWHNLPAQCSRPACSHVHMIRELHPKRLSKQWKKNCH